jgi:hypothetical protein
VLFNIEKQRKKVLGQRLLVTLPLLKTLLCLSLFLPLEDLEKDHSPALKKQKIAL